MRRRDTAGRVVLVTGASRGIGRATAELLADRGAVVVATGRDEPALAAVTARTGGSYLAADLTEPAAPEALVEHAVAAHGRLDGLVVNAGAGHVGPFGQMTAGQVAGLVDLDLRAPLLLARAAIPALRTSPGRQRGIVFVGSIAGAVGVPEESAYSACKSALGTFAELLAEELRADGIRVSTVLPGVVDTEFLAGRAVPYDRRFPRPVPPERVARVIADALDGGPARRFVPRWLVVPARLAGAVPGSYRRLARRFG
ncbi:MAG TPA: SDR family oxidoreductase [Jatrophihabitans sp.]|nr:SDR family oxidoreductase [Jatrophihabitans sp.]